MNNEALEFVMDFYQVDRATALQLYWDEIEAYERILAWKEAESVQGVFDWDAATEDTKDA
jgi:hypothetical protein